MLHLYAKFGSDQPSFRRLSNDPSDDYTSIALKNNDTVSIWIRCEPKNAPQGQPRHMNLLLEQDSTEDEFPLDAAVGSILLTSVEDDTIIPSQEVTGTTSQVLMEGTFNALTSGAAIELVGSASNWIVVVDMKSETNKLKISLSPNEVELEIGDTKLSLDQTVPCTKFQGQEVTATTMLTSRDEELDVEFYLVGKNGTTFCMDKTTITGASNTTSSIFDGSWNTGTPDAWTSYDIQMAIFQDPAALPDIDLFKGLLYTSYRNTQESIVIDEEGTAYPIGLNSSAERPSNVKIAM
jgi:hypothetical protein